MIKMPVLKLLVDKTMEEKKFFEAIKERTKKADMVKNPFNASMLFVSTKSQLMVILDLEPIYPDYVPKIGLFLAGVSMLFSWRVTMIMGFVLASTYIFWTDKFFYFILKRARKKQGIKGKIQLVNNKDAWRGVMRSLGK